jgi:hypothetical protein
MAEHDREIDGQKMQARNTLVCLVVALPGKVSAGAPISRKRDVVAIESGTAPSL